ncbi:hypothetical protein Hanom_Chr13g01232771 [Helianthus anomalus]
MSVQQDQTQGSTGVTIESVIDSIFVQGTNADGEANANDPLIRIPKVREMGRDTEGFKECYVPKIVSIGPYYFGDPRFQLFEQRKPVFAMSLFSGNKETLRRLYNKLFEMVQELRSFYAKDSTTKFCDNVFTKMMLLDGCFILHCIGILHEDFLQWIKLEEIDLIHYRDFLLLENQIPFKVLTEVMKLLNKENYLDKMIQRYLKIAIFVSPPKPKLPKWLTSILCLRFDQSLHVEPKLEAMDTKPDHLLHLLHILHTGKDKHSKNYKLIEYRCNFRNVSELVDLGIHFKPSDTMSFAHFVFSKGWWGFSPIVKLPPIYVNDGARARLLNLAAYEICSRNKELWVSSYITLLDSLIDDTADAKLLRKAWVLEIYNMGSDEEVSKLFNGIGKELFMNRAYTEVMQEIQRHYGSFRNRLLSQLKHEYFRSPWAIFALLGALMALFLTGVQTYYAIWSPKGTCDDLCMFLKRNHHL